MEIIFNIFHVEYNTSTRNIAVYECVRYAIKLIGVEGEISYLKKQSMLYDLQYAPVWILELLINMRSAEPLLSRSVSDSECKLRLARFCPSITRGLRGV